MIAVSKLFLICQIIKSKLASFEDYITIQANWWFFKGQSQIQIENNQNYIGGQHNFDEDTVVQIFYYLEPHYQISTQVRAIFASCIQSFRVQFDDAIQNIDHSQFTSNQPIDLSFSFLHTSRLLNVEIIQQKQVKYVMMAITQDLVDVINVKVVVNQSVLIVKIHFESNVYLVGIQLMGDVNKDAEMARLLQYLMNNVMIFLVAIVQIVNISNVKIIAKCAIKISVIFAFIHISQYMDFVNQKVVILSLRMNQNNMMMEMIFHSMDVMNVNINDLMVVYCVNKVIYVKSVMKIYPFRILLTTKCENIGYVQNIRQIQQIIVIIMIYNVLKIMYFKIIFVLINVEMDYQIVYMKNVMTEIIMEVIDALRFVILNNVFCVIMLRINYLHVHLLYLMMLI